MNLLKTLFYKNINSKEKSEHVIPIRIMSLCGALSYLCVLGSTNQSVNIMNTAIGLSLLILINIVPTLKFNKIRSLLFLTSNEKTLLTTIENSLTKESHSIKNFELDNPLNFAVLFHTPSGIIGVDTHYEKSNLIAQSSKIILMDPTNDKIADISHKVSNREIFIKEVSFRIQEYLKNKKQKIAEEESKKAKNQWAAIKKHLNAKNSPQLAENIMEIIKTEFSIDNVKVEQLPTSAYHYTMTFDLRDEAVLLIKRTGLLDYDVFLKNDENIFDLKRHIYKNHDSDSKHRWQDIKDLCDFVRKEQLKNILPSMDTELESFETGDSDTMFNNLVNSQKHINKSTR